MSDDISARLRDASHGIRLSREAADHIDAQAAEITRLLDAVETEREENRWAYINAALEDSTSEAHDKIKSQAATIKTLVEALEPFCFYDEDDPSEPVQTAWEMMYLDRFKKWIDFGDIESARSALAAAKRGL